MEADFEPEIVVLYCGRTLAEGSYLSESTKKGPGFRVRFVMLPCSSKVEVGHLMNLVENGVDGIELVACPEKACRFLTGNDAAKSRIKHAARLLEEIGLGTDRLGMIHGHDLSAKDMMAIAQNRARAVQAVKKDMGKSKMDT